jgi:hypothetical protein
MSHIDINHGVDFERAQERLSNKAGERFRRYREANGREDASPDEVEQLRAAYLDAQNEQEALLAHDINAIRVVLATSP